MSTNIVLRESRLVQAFGTYLFVALPVGYGLAFMYNPVYLPGRDQAIDIFPLQVWGSLFLALGVGMLVAHLLRETNPNLIVWAFLIAACAWASWGVLSSVPLFEDVRNAPYADPLGFGFITGTYLLRMLTEIRLRASQQNWSHNVEQEEVEGPHGYEYYHGPGKPGSH